ncbi:MAG: PH domain-containing protein [Clostridiales bacterium]|nr:PH domain-containing protein [Clostridiales bacterium]
MEDKLLFQHIMNYKAYRRIMIATRVVIAVVIAIGMAFVGLWNLVLGIMLPIIVFFIAAVLIVVSLQHDETYMVFEDRVVIKSGDKRKVIPTDNIKTVSYRRAFYEKDLATGTVKIRAVSEKKTVGTYRLKHVFDARAVVEYLTDVAKKNKGEVSANE